MRRWIVPLLVLNLSILIALAFAYPHLMVSPGPLRQAHADLTTDCFACHSLFRGASPERCMACHALQDIGVRTTSGIALDEGQRVAFHQELTTARCMDCHVEHRSGTSGGLDPRFSHALLAEATRSRCEGCHRAPDTRVHASAVLPCAECHTTAGWLPASFDHQRLGQAGMERCGSCHAPPANGLHRDVGDACGTCHRTTAWKPATFDHARFFALEGEHDAPCATCHVNDRYGEYTCYGCHEHTPARVAREHDEEGIRNIEDCVRCHRSGSEDGEDGRERD